MSIQRRLYGKMEELKTMATFIAVAMVIVLRK